MPSRLRFQVIYLILRISHYSTAPYISKPETENNCSAEGAPKISWLFMKHKQHDKFCRIKILYMQCRLLLLNTRTKLLKILYWIISSNYLRRDAPTLHIKYFASSSGENSCSDHERLRKMEGEKFDLLTVLRIVPVERDVLSVRCWTSNQAKPYGGECIM
jgi:hypothetical protein